MDSFTEEGDSVQARLWTLATAVRDACYAAALTAYEDARVDGLCADGAWECALSAMKSVDFQAVVAQAERE